MSDTTGGSRSFVLGLAAVVVLALLWALRDIVVLVSFSVLLAYALDPLVGALERLGWRRGPRLSRPAAAAVLMFLLVLTVGWLLSFGVPRLVSELGGFAQSLPTNAERLLLELRAWAINQGLGAYVDPAIESMRASASAWLNDLGASAVGWTGSVFRGLGQMVGLAILPLLAFYLLAEREAVQASAMRFVPAEMHARLREVIAAVDRALKSYVRGQALVSLIMGTAVGVALALLGFPVALLLAVIVGLAETLPFIGFAIAAGAIAIAGYGVDPMRAVIGVIVYTVINTLIGFLVTPRVMGRHLKMHPFVITVSVLAGAELLGPPGALLALPGAAVIQSLASEFATRRRAR